MYCLPKVKGKKPRSEAKQAYSAVVYSKTQGSRVLLKHKQISSYEIFADFFIRLATIVVKYLHD